MTIKTTLRHCKNNCKNNGNLIAVWCMLYQPLERIMQRVGETAFAACGKNPLEFRSMQIYHTATTTKSIPLLRRPLI